MQMPTRRIVELMISDANCVMQIWIHISKMSWNSYSMFQLTPLLFETAEVADEALLLAFLFFDIADDGVEVSPVMVTGSVSSSPVIDMSTVTWVVTGELGGESGTSLMAFSCLSPNWAK